jgi:protein-S-isoprenylcysteine O-methyltransferase Ste14
MGGDGERREVRAGVARRLAQVATGLLAYAALLLGCAGRATWGWGWAFLAATLGAIAANATVMPPELVAERGRSKADARAWDRALTRLGAVPYLALPAVAGLDERWRLSPEMPGAAHLAGLAAFLIGQGLFTWAVASNRFFSTAVRIQADRGHVVETRGPYALVRHPGYAGAGLATLASAFALGSWWAIVPAAATVAVLAARTALEDRALRAELPGYEDYARRVRWRLVPGIW